MGHNAKRHEQVSNQRAIQSLRDTGGQSHHPTHARSPLVSWVLRPCVHPANGLPLPLPSLCREAWRHSPSLGKAKRAVPTGHHSGPCSGSGQAHLSPAGQRKGPQGHGCPLQPGGIPEPSVQTPHHHDQGPLRPHPHASHPTVVLQPGLPPETGLASSLPQHFQGRAPPKPEHGLCMSLPEPRPDGTQRGALARTLCPLDSATFLWAGIAASLSNTGFSLRPGLNPGCAGHTAYPR